MKMLSNFIRSAFAVFALVVSAHALADDPIETGTFNNKAIYGYDTVAYFRMYQELMEFWEKQYGDKIYHIDYERLTIEQEIETKKLIKHLKLDWDDACLLPQENRRNVRTASRQQVKEKVYKGSSKAWRKYENFLNDYFRVHRPSKDSILKNNISSFADLK